MQIRPGTGGRCGPEAVAIDRNVDIGKASVDEHFVSFPMRPGEPRELGECLPAQCGLPHPVLDIVDSGPPVLALALPSDGAGVDTHRFLSRSDGLKYCMNAPMLTSGTSSGAPSRRWACRFSSRSTRVVVSGAASILCLDFHPISGVAEGGTAECSLMCTRGSRSTGADSVRAQVTRSPCAVRIRTTDVSSLSMALAR